MSGAHVFWVKTTRNPLTAHADQIPRPGRPHRTGPLGTHVERPLVITQLRGQGGMLSLAWQAPIAWYRRRAAFAALSAAFDLSGYTPRSLKTPWLITPGLPGAELIGAIDRLEAAGDTVELRINEGLGDAAHW